MLHQHCKSLSIFGNHGGRKIDVTIDPLGNIAKGKRMKRIALVFLLAVLSEIASAEWSRISDEFDTYVDVSTIRKDGDIASVWILMDHEKPSIGKRALSTKLKEEYDCRGERTRALGFISYSGNMGQGAVVDTNGTVAAWRLIVPDTFGATMMKIACSGQISAGQGSGGQVPPPAGDVKTILNQMPNARWQLVGPNNWGNIPATDYIDVSPRVVDDKGLVSLLDKVELSSPIQTGRGGATYVLSLTYFNCKEKTATMSAWIHFDTNWQRVNETDIPISDMKAAKINPGTLSEIEFKHACKDYLARSDPSPSSPSNVPQTTASSGTAWLSDSGYMITAHHVIANARKITLYGADKNPIPATIVVVDAANDLAVLLPNFKGTPPRGLSLNAANPNLGAKVFTIGFPHPDLMGLSAKLTSGEVSSIAGLRDDPRILQISVPVQSGNSGGPLVNMNGEVVGIISAKLSASQVLRTTGDLPQNVNYAVKARYLQGLLADLPRRTALRITPKLGSSLEDLGGLSQPAVFLVITE